jgi:hypothetical protein
MITVEGFSPLQRELADKMWALDSFEDLEDFILSLPRNLRRTAITVRDMLVLVNIDEFVAEMPQFPDVELLVDRFRV